MGFQMQSKEEYWGLVCKSSRKTVMEADAIADKLWKALRGSAPFRGESSQLRHSGAKDKNTRGYQRQITSSTHREKNLADLLVSLGKSENAAVGGGKKPFFPLHAPVQPPSLSLL